MADRGAVFISTLEYMLWESCSSGKGNVAEGMFVARTAFLGRMQNMLRTVTTVERYHSIQKNHLLLMKKRKGNVINAMNARTALFMVFFYKGESNL